MKIARTQEYLSYPNYFEYMRAAFTERRNRIISVLSKSEAGLRVLPSEGGYFVLLYIRDVCEGKLPLKYFYKDYATNPDRPQGVLQKFEDWLQLEDIDFSPDYAFCFYWAVEKRIVMWPISGFLSQYTLPPKSRTQVEYVRVALCKSEESITKLEKLLG